MWFLLTILNVLQKEFYGFILSWMFYYFTPISNKATFKREWEFLTISIIHLCWIVIVLFFIYSKSKVKLAKPRNRIKWLNIVNQELHQTKLLWGWLVLSMSQWKGHQAIALVPHIVLLLLLSLLAWLFLLLFQYLWMVWF